MVKGGGSKIARISISSGMFGRIARIIRDGNFYQWKFPTLRGIFEMIGRNFNSRISMLPRSVRRSFLLSSEKSRILFHDLVKEMGLLLSSPRLGGSQEI